MTLDDFFTLTEINNGLSAPSRVRELMAVMVQEENCAAKNAADLTRQWSAVSSAIVATENKECLDLFLQLDGLDFISKWLKDAQKFDDDKIHSFVEESITHLLQALEKLGTDHEKLLASGIWTTVQNLLVHNNSKVQEKAGAMFESWKQKNNTTSISAVEKTGAPTVDKPEKTVDIDRGIGHSESPKSDGSICRENHVNAKGHELDDPDLSKSSNDSKLVESANNLDKSITLPSGDEGSLNHVNLPSVQKSTMDSALCSPVNTTSGPYVAAVPRQDTLNTHRECHDSESSNYTMEPMKIESFLDEVGLLETSKGRSLTSSSVVVKERKSVTESSQKNSAAVEQKSCHESFSCIDSKEMDSDTDGVKYKDDASNQCRASSEFIAGGTSNHHMFPRSSNSEKSWGSPKYLGTFISGTEDKGKVNTPGVQVSEKNVAKIYTFGKKMMDKGPDQSGKKSDVEIDYGIVDPLEVARLVAMEVEREVVDYREPSCSSSEKLPECNVRQPNSPEYVSQKQSRSNEGSPKEVVSDSNLSDESSPMQEDSATSSGKQDAELANGTQDMAISLLTEVAQEEANEEKGLCQFDLNEEVCSEDLNLCENQYFAPVSFVSASKAAAAPGLPGAPLQFEGNLGWKGSAVTSAFHPASPRRTWESNKDPSTGGSSSGSKQRQGCLDIDLNVAEIIDPRLGDMTADKHVQFYSTVASGESSAETSSRRSEHLALDLNHSSEDAGALLDWRIGQFIPQSHQHRGQPLSSMSSKQPTRNIDLNDQPAFVSDPSVTTYLRASQTVDVFGGIKSDNSAISLMGKRVEVNMKELGSQTPQLANERILELPFDINLGRTGNFLGVGYAPFAHLPGYVYPDITSAPPMPFPSTIYGSGGHIPYMVDSRGQPVFPQIVGSASALPASHAQPPFLVNLNTSAPSNGVGTSRSSFDVNSAMPLESGSKDPSGFGLFLNSAVRSVDEQQLKPNSQPTMNPAFGVKRKEPENGWEHYPFKHYTPPWNQS